MDLSAVSQSQLDSVARKLNTRPRETLNRKTPAYSQSFPCNSLPPLRYFVFPRNRSGVDTRPGYHSLQADFSVPIHRPQSRFLADSRLTADNALSNQGQKGTW